MRIIPVALFVILFLIIGIPVLGIEWLIGKISKKTMDYSSLRIVQWAFKVIVRLAGIELTVIGEENVPKNIPVLYIGNHRSFFDIVITYARCPRLTGYVAKDSMKKVPPSLRLDGAPLLPLPEPHRYQGRLKDHPHRH